MWEKRELSFAAVAAVAMAVFGIIHTPSIFFSFFLIKCHERIAIDLTTILLKFSFL
jgi:hypothetical protein